MDLGGDFVAVRVCPSIVVVSSYSVNDDEFDRARFVVVRFVAPSEAGSIAVARTNGVQVRRSICPSEGAADLRPETSGHSMV
eukprot:scaffold190668_cov33-Prasinocladus_malaysianus.AAC.1